MKVSDLKLSKIDKISTTLTIIWIWCYYLFVYSFYVNHKETRKKTPKKNVTSFFQPVKFL